MSTRLCVIGTIAADPYYSNSDSKAAFCSFRIASNDRYYDREKNDWVDAGTNWYTVNTFRGLAEHTHESFAKGDRIVAYGRVRVQNWESNQKSGTRIEIDAEALGHDLRWGVSNFTKRVGSDSRGEDANSGQSGSATSSPPNEQGAPASQGRWLSDGGPVQGDTPSQEGFGSSGSGATTAGQQELSADKFTPAAA